MASNNPAYNAQSGLIHSMRGIYRNTKNIFNSSRPASQQSLSSPTPGLSSTAPTSQTQAAAFNLSRISGSNPAAPVQSQARNQTWKALKSALDALYKASKVLPPLQSTIDDLIDCINTIPVSARRRQDYKDFASTLENLAKSLEGNLNELRYTRMSDGVVNVVSLIRKEIQDINMNREQSTARRVFEANQDEDQIIQCYRRIEVLLRRLQTHVSLSTWSIANEQLVNTRLEGLSPARLASYNSTLAQDIGRRTCTKNTRINILEVLNGWLQDPKGQQIFWMSGMAGTGKTTIACTMADALAKREKLGASFFCARSSPECRSAKRIIPTIAYQLARYSCPFQTAVCHALKSDPDISTRQISLQFERLLQEPLKKAKDAMPDSIVIIIDALDECEDSEGVRVILDMLFQCADLPLRFFVTSRPEPEIYNTMLCQTSESRSIFHLHEIERSLVQGDIELYLKEELKFMRSSEQEISQLAQQAGNLFIYAATVVRYLRPGNKAVNSLGRLRAVLALRSDSSRKYAELDALYTTILERALDKENLEPQELDRAQLVLWTVVCASEPLLVGTISVLSALSDEDTQAVLQSLRSVLHVSETSCRISSLHVSFPEFILNRERSGRFFCDKSHFSQQLAQRCFGVMKTELRFNICRLESSFILDEAIPDLKERVTNIINATLYYSCRYWGEHLISTTDLKGLHGPLKEFLSNQLLFWMEVLNLTKCMIIGMSMLQNVWSWLLAREAPGETVTLVRDASNFVALFGANPASLSTPHIYISAFPFCPKSSTVFVNYTKRMRGLMRVNTSATQPGGSAALASWATGCEVRCLALSSAGDRLAFGSDRGDLKVISPLNGTLLAGPFLGHHGSINSVAFSPDGEQLASGSSDFTIRIWNKLGGIVTIITCPSPTTKRDNVGINSVAFSQDGARIGSGSSDCNVRLYKAQDGTLVIGPFQGHSGPVNSVAFTPDGMRIASGSDDKTIRVWDTHDGTLVAGPFVGHTWAIHSVAFSPDGVRIVSGSGDCAVCIWGAESGVLLAGPFSGHTDAVKSVAFSPDGKHIVSGSTDRIICVSNVQYGTSTVNPFEGHAAAVNSIAILPDGTRVFSGSVDGTIRSWNLDLEGDTPAVNPFRGHSDWIESLSFSPDSTRIVSGSRDCTICIWGVHDGALLTGPLEGHTDSILSVAFSPDGAYIVSGSRDCTIRVWRVQDGSLALGPLEGHTGAVNCIAFSVDGTRLVSGADDRGIRVWDIQTGILQLVTNLDQSAGYVSTRTRNVSFSANDAQIMSTSYSEPRQLFVWNAQTGLLVSSPLSFAGSLYGFGQPVPIASTAFSPDRRYLAWGMRHGGISVWQGRSSSIAHPFQAHKQPVTSLAFSQDALHIVSGSEDLTTRVWSVNGGSPIAGPFEGHIGSINSVAFSPDNTFVASGSSDCTIRISIVQNLPIENLALAGEWDTTDSGWVVNTHGQFLFWAPQEISVFVPRPYNIVVIGSQGAMQIDYTNIMLGEHWSECYVDS